MDIGSQDEVDNRLLRRLGADSFAAFAPNLEQVLLPKGTELSLPDEPVEHVYFLERGIGSIVVMSPELHEAESGLFGREGFSLVGAALGVDRAPYRVVMQVGGAGLRMEADRFRHVMALDAAARSVFLLYAQVHSVQSAFTALSNAVHPIDERLARWLLMCHDRVDGDSLPLTHEFLAIMLAVRRPSVTTALHVLEGNRFITAERGNITVRHRDLLEEFAGDAYGRPEAEYTRLLGNFRA